MLVYGLAENTWSGFLTMKRISPGPFGQQSAFEGLKGLLEVRGLSTFEVGGTPALPALLLTTLSQAQELHQVHAILIKRRH
jgi:hypothetical protein